MKSSSPILVRNQRKSFADYSSRTACLVLIWLSTANLFTLHDRLPTNAWHRRCTSIVSSMIRKRLRTYRIQEHFWHVDILLSRVNFYDQLASASSTASFSHGLILCCDDTVRAITFICACLRRETHSEGYEKNNLAVEGEADDLHVKARKSMINQVDTHTERCRALLDIENISAESLDELGCQLERSIATSLWCQERHYWRSTDTKSNGEEIIIYCDSQSAVSFSYSFSNKIKHIEKCYLLPNYVTLTKTM